MTFRFQLFLFAFCGCAGMVTGFIIQHSWWSVAAMFLCACVWYKLMDREFVAAVNAGSCQ
jgi:hypothetical protein